MDKNEILERFNDYSRITEDEVKNLFFALGIDNGTEDDLKPQVLCHCAGEHGVEHLDDILNESGLQINNREYVDGNTNLSSGLLSTNTLMTFDNNIIYNGVINDFFRVVTTSEGDFSYSLILVLPVVIDEMVLGRIIADRKGFNSCVFDDLLKETGLNNIPKEFILGVKKTKYLKTTKIEDCFKINKNFYALNQENYKYAANIIREMFTKAAGSYDNYYEKVLTEANINNKSIKNGLSPLFPKYVNNAAEIYNKLKQCENIEE